MSGGQLAVPLGSATVDHPRPHRSWFRHLHRSDLVWSVAFVAPYVVIFLAFALYPIGAALWMARDPSLYDALFADTHYVDAAVNTTVFVGVGVNLEMFLALLLSGFFARRRRWIKLVLIVFLLPWTVPAVPAYISFHWMLITGPMGLVDHLLRLVTGFAGPEWLLERWSAVGCDIAAAIWKWLPLWTVIFLGGRMAIPQDLYDAAEIDGSSAFQCFRHITVPLLASLYLISTLIAAIWTLGDYSPSMFVSSGAPGYASSVISQLGFHYAFDTIRPALGVAAGLTVLPLVILLIIGLTRALARSEVQL
jgi:multiple sugar transport system permease protein